MLWHHYIIQRMCIYLAVTSRDLFYQQPYGAHACTAVNGLKTEGEMQSFVLPQSLNEKVLLLLSAGTQP